VVSLSLTIYGRCVPDSDGQLFSRTKYDFTRTPRRLMTKLIKETEYSFSDGCIKLTTSGVARLGLAVANAMALWDALQ
jgi:hypothetical protein